MRKLNVYAHQQVMVTVANAIWKGVTQPKGGKRAEADIKRGIPARKVFGGIRDRHARNLKAKA